MRIFSRCGGAAVVAAVLSLALAGPVSATTWGPPIPMGPNGFEPGLKALGGFHVVALHATWGDFDENRSHLYIRHRVLFRGVPVWLDPIRIATNARLEDGTRPALAASGEAVDVLYMSMGFRASYLRSTDSGATFPYGVQLLSPKTHTYILGTSVARRGDLVVAAWGMYTAATGYRVFVRVSTDGGANFGPLKDFAGHSPSVAVGKGVIYLANMGPGRLNLRRSFNAGGKWSAKQVLSSTATAYHEPWGNISASGDTAYVAYTTQANPDARPVAKHRRTLNRGGSWSAASALDLGTAFGVKTFGPTITVQANAVLAVWQRCADSDCNGGPLYYAKRTSSGWPLPEYVAGGGLWETAVMAEGTVIVNYDRYVREGTP